VPPVAGGLRPFAEVVKDAKRSEGLFPLWQKDDKVWLEIGAEALNQPFFLSTRIKTGIGENYLFGGLLGFVDGVVEFRRIHNQIQLVWRNTEFVARPGTPEAFAVEAAFSPSLVASTPVLSQSHPERKAILVEANALFVADLTATASQLQRSYRQGYAFDARNSAITALRNTPDASTIEVLNHFATAAISPAQAAQPGAPTPSVPRAVPDARSLFIAIHYTLARCPSAAAAAPATRASGASRSIVDRRRHRAKSRQRYVNRWRLTRRMAAALSEPVADRFHRPRCRSPAQRGRPRRCGGTAPSRRPVSRTRCASRRRPPTRSSTRSTMAMWRSAG
jgi:hypothetical protein